ncbi:MAG: prepilin-type N-terminal cleavage/methylation domain-containing protein [Planctomycetaceae bacterium]|nr:prepilin-type N-terminal cleavage/methylation domain-containing protein [Planctomycetaceae bacterium]
MNRRTDTMRRARGFSLVEMLIALAISAALLVAVLSALVASFRAYQATTEQASTHVVGRVIMHRMMALVRNGVDFGPLPEDARDRYVVTDEFIFVDEDGREIALRLDRAASALLMQVDDASEQLLLEGVRGPADSTGEAIGAFTLEFENGTRLVRASFDLTVDADDNASVALEGDEVIPIRLVGSTAPRRLTW